MSLSPVRSPQNAGEADQLIGRRIRINATDNSCFTGTVINSYEMWNVPNSEPVRTVVRLSPARPTHFQHSSLKFLEWDPKEEVWIAIVLPSLGPFPRVEVMFTDGRD